jgi:DNA primase
MGKVSPVAAKYIIHLDISIEGGVDKPDVIGAIFGQTEGFLGSELELRELQRSGKIGRIEVKLDIANGKSHGEIVIPSNMDKAETAIIGAALETIERIGPCNSKVVVKKIEDVRISKRAFVISRAKELLQTFQSEVLPDSHEITEQVSQAVRVQEVGEWGPERLPAGPAVNESEEIILVEGRADVLNLLKQGIKNTVAMNGTSVPESVKELCRQKVVTAFVDGDRGGDLILRELLATTELDYITKAPDGKEVEELTKKEIHIALRAKVASEQFKLEGTNGANKMKPQLQTVAPQQQGFRRPMNPRFGNREYNNNGPREYQPRENVERAPMQAAPQTVKKDYSVFKPMIEDLIGTRGAYLLDKDSKILGKVPVSELEPTLKQIDNVDAVLFDGQITRELAKTAESSKVSTLIGMTSMLRPGEVKVATLTYKDLQ